MLVLKSALGAFLCGTFLVATGPAFFFQEPTAGRADDVAELMPADAIIFAEFAKAPAILKDWKEYVGAFCKAEGKAKVCEEIEKAVSEGLDIVPEKLLKDFKEGLPTLQRLAVALTPPQADEEVGWLLVATSSDAGFFKKIVDQDLKIFAFEERAHAGVKVQAIRKMGEMKFGDTPILVAAAGNRLLLTTSWPSMCAALDRAAGKGKGDDLRKNPLYAKFSPPAGDDPSFRAFAALDFERIFGPRGYGMSGRSNAHSLDEIDAVIDLRKIRGGVLEATFKPGRVTSTMRIHVDSPCRLYETWRQSPGPKELIKHLPETAQVVAHVNVKSGAALWADVEKLLRRASEVQKKQSAARGMSDEREDLLAEFKRNMERELGVGPDDAAAVIGQEAVFAFVGDEAFTSERATVGAILVLIHTTDAEKAKAHIEKWVERSGAYDASKEGEAHVWAAKQEGELASIALHGNVAMFAGKAETLRAAIKAKETGGLSKRLPAGHEQASKLIMGKSRAVWMAVQAASGGKVPDLSKELDLDQWAGVVITEDKTHCTLSSADVGLGWAAQASVMAFPLIVTVSGSRRRADMAGGAPPAAGPEEPKEPPKLPADKLAEEVKKHVADLRSEEMPVRTGAKDALKALGRQAAPLIVEAVKKETDLDAKEHLMDILVAWKVYDAFPELLGRKVDSFVREVQDLFAKQDPNEWRGGFVQWPMEEQNPSMGFPWGMEPYYANTHLLDTLQHRDVLTIPDGLKGLTQRLSHEKVPVETQRSLAAILAFSDCSKAEEALLAARTKASDQAVRVYLQIALGSCGGAKAREALVGGFKDANRWISRASFIAAERTKDAEVVGRLFELLKDGDLETRWNASFVLRGLSDGKVAVNVYWPDEEFNAALAAGREWWEKKKK